MKKLLTTMLCATLLLSCQGKKEKEFKGYIVVKEFTPEHKCHDNVKTVEYAIISHPIHVPHFHHSIEAEYVWYCANKHEIVKRFVSKRVFYSK